MNNKKNKIVISIVLVLIVIVSAAVTAIILHKNNMQNNTTVASESDNMQANDKKQSDNGEYLSLEDDENAEDAVKVADISQKIEKKEVNYPVRDDGKKVVYLTFDDGPSRTNTPKVLDILKQYGIKATFFVTGKSVDSGDTEKELIKRMAKEGHAIGNHTYNHDYSKIYPGRVINPEAFLAEIDQTEKSLKNVLGQDFHTRAIRFPGGYWSWEGRTAIRPLLDERGDAILDWQALSGDAEAAGRTKDQLIAEIKKTTEDLGPNADSIIVLNHDTYGKEATVEALPEIIQYYKDKGFEFKTLK